MTTSRLDVALVKRGLVDSRAKAHGAITAGGVRVAGRVVTKPSYPVEHDVRVELNVDVSDVGRGAIKLRHALDHFGVSVAGSVVVDVGASTGGFTQVALDRGARQVVAIDVGHGQLHPRLAGDPRVVNREGVNIVEVTALWWEQEGLPEASHVVVDVSFMSLAAVIPHLATLFPHQDMIALVKPQFEVGRGRTRGGIVRNELDRDEALQRVVQAATTAGFAHATSTASPIEGKKGNREYLVHFSRHIRGR